MLSFFTKEKLGVIFFLSLVFLNALFLSQDNLSEKYLGVLTFLWGVFGLYRYNELRQLLTVKIPDILTLPSRILFGLNQGIKSPVNKALEGFFDIHILLFFAFSLLFISWGLYCTFYPLEISLIQSYWADKQEILQNFNIDPQNYFIILEKISYYFIITLTIFIGVTYSYQKFLQKYFKLFFLAFIFLMAVFIIFFNPLFSIHIYFDFSYWKGIGWGQFDVFKKISLYDHTDLNSGFLRRYIETGLVGAYGLYMVFLPLFWVVVKQAFVVPRHYVHFAMMAVLLLMSFILDFFWLWHSVIGSFQFLTVTYIACSWKNISVSTQGP